MNKTVHFPDTFKSRMQDMLGEEYAAFEKSYQKPFHNGLRANTLKISPQELAHALPGLDRGVPWAPNGFYISDKKTYSSHPYYHAGIYYLQEASAMLPAVLCGARPGERVLDLCAAPGGKSTAAAASMEGRGLLVSNDISRSRAKALLHNIETAGAGCCMVTSAAPEKLAALLPEYFDRILVDAPCSGEGMFHKDSAMMGAWQKNGPEFYETLQHQILLAAAAMLRPGGRLVYSTCTFSAREDEGSVSFLLEQEPSFYVKDMEEELPGIYEKTGRGVPAWGNGSRQLANTIRIWPHRCEGEGHFTAVLIKGGQETAGPPERGDAPEENCASDAGPFLDFLKKEGIDFQPDKRRLRIREGYVQYLPDYLPALPGVHVLRSGVLLGQIKKGRFEPSAAMSRILDPACCRKRISFPADSQQVLRYLRCETINCGESLESGWTLVCTDDYPLGWAKASGSQLKNKYPAAWRIL